MSVAEAPPAFSPHRQRIRDALDHREPDQVPIDFFGTTGVTSIQVSGVAALRGYCAPERRPMKVIEPHRMVGLIDEDLKQILGLDVEGVYRRRTMFGFENKDWKPWDRNGLDVLVPGRLNTTVADNGDTPIYPEGDLAAAPSGRMPRGFHFFDASDRLRRLRRGRQLGRCPGPPAARGRRLGVRPGSAPAPGRGMGFVGPLGPAPSGACTGSLGRGIVG